MKPTLTILALGLVVLAPFGFAATEIMPINFNHLIIHTSTKGNCVSSAASSMPNAWRCFADNGIQDPCFSHPNESTLTCLQNPWATHATRLVLTTALPQPDKLIPERLPWAVQLTDDEKCVFMTGGMFPIEGERANYGCSKDIYLYGDINKTHANWTINYYNMVTKKKQTVTIKKVWN